MDKFWGSADKPVLSRKAVSVIENRTGHPQPLLKKVEEKLSKK